MEHHDNELDGVVIYYQDFEYSLVDLVDGVTFWQCRYKKSFECDSTMKTKDSFVVQEPTPHSHEGCHKRTKEHSSEEQKNYVRTTVTPSSGALQDSSDKIDENLLFGPPSPMEEDFSNPTPIRNELVIPSFTSGIPIEFAELVVHDCSNFNEDGILVLGNQTVMAHLNAELIYGISFHHHLPPKFTQLYTWHAKVGQLYFPCVYVLMKTQDIKSYVDMFEVLKNTVPNINPKKILMDFHTEGMMAARGAFPQAQVKGSFFNMTQILFEKVKDLGIENLTRREIDIKFSLMCLPSLMFVPPRDVRDLFDDVALTLPVKKPFNELLSYFCAKFIEGPMGTDPRFPISLWNHYDDALEDTAITKNTAEVLHKAVYSQFEKWSTCPWFLLSIIKTEALNNVDVLDNFDRLEPAYRETKPPPYLSKVVKRYSKMTNKLAYLHNLIDLL